MSKHPLISKLVDAGISLAYSTRGAGIAGVWAEFLRQHIRVVEGPDAEFRTWAVDGTAMWVNADFTAGLTSPEIQFLIAHETMHVALDHVESMRAVGATTPELRRLLNIAQDAIINQALIDDGIGTMPSGSKQGVTLQQFVDKGYTGPRDSVALYEWLLKEQKQQPKGGQGGGKGKPQKGTGQAQGDANGQGDALQGCSPSGLPGDNEGQQGQGDKAGQGEASAKAKVRAERARATLKEASQRAGEGSAIADLLEPRPTRATVRQLVRQGFERASMHARNRTHPSYSRAGRRVADESIITPGKIGTEARVAFLGDVSGSMTDKGRAALIGFILAVSREFPEVRVYLVTHTSRVEWEGWLTAGGDLERAKAATGFSGGTDFKPAYDAVSKAGRFDVAVHFTDGFNSREWPEPCARQLIVGLWGSGNGATPAPEGTRVVPVASVEGDL